MESKNIVHGLWISGNLSSLELLTIHSFLEHGYQFYFWTYENTLQNLPPGVIIKDAGEIIKEEEVFQYSYENQFGHGKGSYAGFSDIFRYKLLYEYGGWWTDMDITCLKRLPSTENYFFRQNKKSAVGNLMHCPKHSEVMLWCYEHAKLKINAQNTNWSLPIQILNDGIEKFELKDYVEKISNNDSWLEVSSLLRDNKIPDHYYCIHWMNEEFRRLDISKERFPEKSNLYQLLERYNLKRFPIQSITERIRFSITTSASYYLLINLKHLPAYLRQK
ncbi:MAG TPA: glycosyltransferase [Chitinophagales bacterium]|nr:glycosyltransferase [Chitinophagales bacterium]